LFRPGQNPKKQAIKLNDGHISRNSHHNDDVVTKSGGTSVSYTQFRSFPYLEPQHTSRQPRKEAE
ncbi:MAG: hypothetical protein WBL33_07635, partial [Candidatus Acidiferrales bacterium]